MERIISSVNPMMHGHLKIEFEDGSSAVIQRGESFGLKVGDTWPPELRGFEMVNPVTLKPAGVPFAGENPILEGQYQNAAPKVDPDTGEVLEP